MFRLLFDKQIRKTGAVDNDLDIFLSVKEADLLALSKANIDLNSLEKKIKKLGKKTEWARWILRALFGGIDVHLNLLFSLDKEPLLAGINASAVALWWYAVAMQSATWKNSTRKKKLEALSDLLHQARKVAAKAKAAA